MQTTPIITPFGFCSARGLVAWLLRVIKNQKPIYIMKMNAELAKTQIAKEKTAGFVPQTIEVDLPESETPYTGIATGEYKVIPYTNAKGKGLLILACISIKHAENTVEVDIPISESKVGMFNEAQEVDFSVSRKSATEPKRVKFLTLTEKEVTN